MQVLRYHLLFPHHHKGCPVEGMTPFRIPNGSQLDVAQGLLGFVVVQELTIEFVHKNLGPFVADGPEGGKYRREVMGT